MSRDLASDLATAIDLIDPVDLFRRTIGEPDPFQVRALRSKSRKLIMVCGRMVGKSAVASVIACHTALTQAGSTVLLCAPSLRQSSLLFSSVMNVYRAVGGLDSPEAESRLSVELSNRSKIICAPGGGEGFKTIRGFDCSAVIVDEAIFTPKEVLEAVVPMLAIHRTPPSRFICLTSASWASGWAFDVFNNTEDKTWQRERVTSYECPRQDRAWLEDTRKTIGESAFRREFLAEFQDPAEGLFGSQVLQDAIDENIIPIRW
jgi:hypothetical protein